MIDPEFLLLPLSYGTSCRRVVPRSNVWDANLLPRLER